MAPACLGKKASHRAISCFFSRQSHYSDISPVLCITVESKKRRAKRCFDSGCLARRQHTFVPSVNVVEFPNCFRRKRRRDPISPYIHIFKRRYDPQSRLRQTVVTKTSIPFKKFMFRLFLRQNQLCVEWYCAGEIFSVLTRERGN